MNIDRLSLEYTKNLDKAYSKYAKLYDISVKVLPIWKSWIKSALPHIEGKRVLEASFGTGYLLMQFADKFETYGIDFSHAMIDTKKMFSMMDVKPDSIFLDVACGIGKYSVQIAQKIGEFNSLVQFKKITQPG